MKNLNLFRKSARGSEGSTLASAVVRPSFDRRLTVVKHLAFMLLFLLGSLNVWGEDVEIVSTFAKVKNESPTASFTASNKGSNNVYSTGTTFTITSKENNVWALAPSTSGSIYFSMNNSEGGFHLGSKNYDAGDATLTSSTSFLNVTQIKISGKTGKSGSVTISVKVGNTSISLKQGSSETFSGSTVATATFISASPISGTVEVTMTDGANNIAYYIESITITTSSDSSDPTACAEPTFSPVAGAVASGTEVTISSTTEGATIYYTMGNNPANPTTGSTQYDANNKPVITSATTIKAIAVKGGYDNSEVASASYTIVTPYTSIASLADAMTNSDQSVYVTFGGWQVSVVKNNQAFVTDGTNGLIIYQSGHGLVEGDILTGTVQCTLVSYNGVVELKGVTKTMDGIAVTSGTISPVVKTIAEANDLTALNTGLLIKLENVTYNGTAFVDESSNTIAPYTTFYNYSSALTSGHKYNVTGIIQQYSSNSQIYPRKPADIEEIIEVGAPEAPTFTPTPDTYTEAKSVSIATTTDDAVVYYTMTNDGSDPATPDTDDASQLYSSAISLSANGTYKFKAVAFKDDLESAVVTATYVINIPLPSHDFQITHKFETGEGFEFPTGWSTSYEAHEIAFTDDKVVFSEANQPSSTSAINDCPVTKDKAISLVLTNTSKIITAVRFDYKQWGAKAQTLTMKYSTDGGATYNAFNPAVSSTNFALQVLDLPDGTNAIQVTGSNGSNQVGLTSIAFDLANKPVVTKTVTITPPSNGTLVVKNAGEAITSGEAIEVGTTLTIEATPNEGYSLSGVTVNGNAYTEATLTLTENVTIAATFVVDVRPAASLKLWENGNEVAYPGDYKQNDHVALPNSVTHNCYGRVFVGWSTTEIAPQTDAKPAYLEPGADFTLSAAGVNNLYAVYAAVATPAGYQKLESNAFETTATYVIGAEQSSTDATMWYFSSYSGTDSNINWGVMTNAPETTAPVEFTLSGTASELVAQDASGNYLAGLNTGKFKMSSTSTTVALSAKGVIGTTNSYVLRHNYNGGNGGLRWYNGTTGTQAYFYKVVSATYNKYSTTCDAAIDAPAFDLSEGTYTSAQTVTITAATGATIYYTMTNDGSEPANPTQSSDVYLSAIPLNAAGTYKFKAFAVKGEAESDITSATYTINLPLTTMDQIFAKATAVGNTETEVTVVFDNWVVSGISTDDKNIYVTDGTKGLVIYDKDALKGGFEVNDKLNGTVTCNLKLYKGFSDIEGLKADATGLTVTHDGEVTPIPANIADLGAINTGAPIILNNVMYNGSVLTDGANTITPYNTFYADAVSSLEENKYYNITGIYVHFNTTKEVAPRSAADIVELTQKAPTMTWYTSDAKTAPIAADATYTINLGDAFAPVFETNSSGDLTYSSNNDAVATINASTGALELQGGAGDVLITCTVAEDAVNNYAAGSQSFTLRVLQGATVDYVVILAQYNGSWYAMKNTGVTNSKAAAIEVAYSEGKVWNLSTSEQEAITWKRTVNGDDVTFQAPNNNYLQTSNNNLAMGAEACIWTWNETYYRTGSQTRTFLYRPSASGFKSNAVSNAGSNDYSALPVIMTAVFADGEGYTEVRSGLEVNRHYTVCLPKNITHIKGATFWNLQYKNAGNTEVYLVEETAPEAGKPYIIQATDTKLEVVYGEEIAAAPVANGALRGTFTGINATNFAALEGTVYLLINNAIRPRTAGNYLDANRAYVRYDELNVGTPASIPGRRVKAMPMAPAVATGVDQVPSDQVPNTKVLINGQLFILRGEKMYDAKGQLVK